MYLYPYIGQGVNRRIKCNDRSAVISRDVHLSLYAWYSQGFSSTRAPRKQISSLVLNTRPFGSINYKALNPMGIGMSGCWALGLPLETCNALNNDKNPEILQEPNKFGKNVK